MGKDANTNQNKAGIAKLIPNRVEFKTKIFH